MKAAVESLTVSSTSLFADVDKFWISPEKIRKYIYQFIATLCIDTINYYHGIDHIFKFTYFVFQVVFVSYVTNKISCMTNNETNHKVKVSFL